LIRAGAPLGLYCARRILEDEWVVWRALARLSGGDFDQTAGVLTLQDVEHPTDRPGKESDPGKCGQKSKCH
jgi:hypothetical protein